METVATRRRQSPWHRNSEVLGKVYLSVLSVSFTGGALVHFTFVMIAGGSIRRDF